MKRGPVALNPDKKRRSRERLAGRGEPKMPAGLTREARAEWRRVTALLRARGVLDGLDQIALADYVLCWTRLGECERDLGERGVLVKGDRGQVKNPSAQLAREYRTSLLNWCRELGLSPASRERLAFPAAPKSDPALNPFLQFVTSDALSVRPETKAPSSWRGPEGKDSA